MDMQVFAFYGHLKSHTQWACKCSRLLVQGCVRSVAGEGQEGHQRAQGREERGLLMQVRSVPLRSISCTLERIDV